DDLLSRALQAQGELKQLLEDVREYAAPVRLDVARCHLGAVWREAWSQARAPAAVEGDVAEGCAGTDLWLSADRARLTQVFRNLFENAIEAAGQAVCIQIVCREATLNGRPALRVIVSDNGPGLGDGLPERVFEPFYTTKPHGTGLGMAIARHIVE